MTGPRLPGLERDWATLARVAGAALANLTVVTALLVYFGWWRAKVESQVMGIDESVRGLSNQYYVLSSIGPLFPVLALLSLFGLGWLWLDGRVTARLGDRAPGPRAQRVLKVATLSWLLLPALVLPVRLFSVTVFRWALPIAVGLGTLVSIYAIHLRRLPRTPRTEAPIRWLLAKGLAAAVVILCLFWAVTAGTVAYYGREENVERDLANRPWVVVYSSERLHLDAPWVREEPLPTDVARFRFRYSGLRLFERTGGKFFLVSDGWTAAHGVVVVLPDDGTVRMEFARVGR